MDKARGVMSQAEYARHRGTSRQYIGKLGKEGVLVMRNGKVDVAATDAVLDDRPVSVEPGNTVHDAPSRGVLDHSGQQPTSLAQARVAEMIYRAKLRRLDFEERSGRLLKRDEVEVAHFNEARIIRDGVLNIADRVSAQLAAETDEKKVHEILTTEIRNALNGIADSLTNGN